MSHYKHKLEKLQIYTKAKQIQDESKEQSKRLELTLA